MKTERQFVFELATPEDDAAIRRLLATNPVPGQVVLTYEREPNYFLGCEALGDFSQVLIARHAPSGDIGGIGSRSVRQRWVNGTVQPVGYLSQLRVTEKHRGRWLVSGGFRLLRELHADQRTASYIATITAENDMAKGVLVERSRRHFPRFLEIDHIYTAALVVRNRQRRFSPDFRFRRATGLDITLVVDFVNRHGAAKQFFPSLSPDALRSNTTAHGVKVDDFVLAYKGNQLVGLTALWDQQAYKQTVVQGYTGVLRWARPLYNVHLRMQGAQPLPAAGGKLRLVYASYVCVADNNPDIFDALLEQAYHIAAKQRYAYLMVGFARRDPLMGVARQYTHIAYHSTLYSVSWNDGGEFHEHLDGRIPYVEIATL